ncbi:hypothetical protein [Nostoc sp. FACHB-133]|uniref:hypothetical protein n=1 Tax=Nostoc sp. FACHB-133 TaxID=2692835 RepID=UPI001683D997|nr:hypothetical protein [Nostoc sp. FACHB-133]MBD2526286.1 hypothetical protein [Nostoc sp. FACHB-133]
MVATKRSPNFPEGTPLVLIGINKTSYSWCNPAVEGLKGTEQIGVETLKITLTSDEQLAFYAS